MEDLLGRVADPTIRKIRVPRATVPAVPDFSREQPMDQPVTMFQPEPKEFVLPGVSLEGMETVQKREDFIQKYMKKNNVGRTAALTAWRNKQKKEKKTVSVPIDINAPLGRAMAAVARTDPTMVFDVRREPEPNVLMVPPQKKQDEITQEVAEPRFV
jgi:hypothetical protein